MVDNEEDDEDEEEKEEEEEAGGRRKDAGRTQEATDIKSNNPHLAGGKKGVGPASAKVKGLVIRSDPEGSCPPYILPSPSCEGGA